MKKRKKLLHLIIGVMILCLNFFSPSQVHAMEAFTIENLNVDMIVEESGLITITETYQMDFKERRHGFYRSIPMKYSMDWNVDGEMKEKDYYFPVSNITSNEEMELEYSNNGVMIRLGDPDQYVYGQKEYVISYQVQTKDLDINEKQLLYWNIVGNEFDTIIKHVDFDIEMPKPISSEAVQGYTGNFGSIESNLNINVKDNHIIGSTTTWLNNYESLTIAVSLPNNYFTFPLPKDYHWIASIISIGLCILAFLLFIRFGKDEELIIPVEFSAPDGLNSAEVGFIIDQSADAKDLISLIIDWANKGYLIIHDNKEGFELEKINEIDENAPYYERKFFESFFSSGNRVNEEQLKKQKMGNNIATARMGLSKYFTSDKKRAIYQGTSRGIQIFAMFLAVVPTFLFMLLNAYGKYELMALAFPNIFFGVFLLLSTIPWLFIVYKRYSMKQISFILLCFVVGIINVFIVALCGILLFLNHASLLSVLIYCISTLILYLCMLFMNKRTKQGNMWLGQILGFKDFILSCEKDRLELLVHDNPTVFYEILPYAYVLGVSDVWSKKFESINVMEPSWYRSSYGNDVFTTTMFYRHFNRCYNDISHASTYIPPTTSGKGGGSFGGGGSSFGGFSGGGFGGGGGGSW